MALIDVYIVYNSHWLILDVTLGLSGGSEKSAVASHHCCAFSLPKSPHGAAGAGAKPRESPWACRSLGLTPPWGLGEMLEAPQGYLQSGCLAPDSGAETSRKGTEGGEAPSLAHNGPALLSPGSWASVACGAEAVGLVGTLGRGDGAGGPGASAKPLAAAPGAQQLPLVPALRQQSRAASSAAGPRQQCSTPSPSLSPST